MHKCKCKYKKAKHDFFATLETRCKFAYTVFLALTYTLKLRVNIAFGLYLHLRLCRKCVSGLGTISSVTHRIGADINVIGTMRQEPHC